MTEADGFQYGYNAQGQRVFKPRFGVPGDVNGDGTVTEEDLGLLQQALRGEGPTMMAMDCNRDGVVDNRDTGCTAQKIGAFKNQGQTHGQSQGRGRGGPPTAEDHTEDPVQIGWTLMLYDDAGRLIGEYDELDRLIRQYVWLDDMPLAVNDRDGIFYIHADHLNTPKVATDSAGAIVWQADYAPFGEVTETVSMLEVNLRFPGQYHDREIGLHQNWYREYVPQLGRYSQADPIGMDGGLNLFNYATANPLRFVDILGLRAYFFRIIVGGGVSHASIPIPGQVFSLEVVDPIRGEVCYYTVACIGIGWSYRATPTTSAGSQSVRWNDGRECSSCRQFEGTGMAGSVAAQVGPIGYTFVDWIDVPNGPRLDLSGYSPAQVSIGGGTFFCRFSL